LGEDTGLRQLSATIGLNARQTDKEPLSAQVHGTIDALGYGKDVYGNIPFEAFCDALKMSLNANADLPVGKIQAHAAMTQGNTPDVNVKIRVDDLHVGNFYKDENWADPRLTLVLNGSIKSLDIDRMTGKVNIDSLRLHDGANFDFRPGKFAMELGENENDKFITITSSLLSADIRGQYAFTSLAGELTDIMHSYLPDVFQAAKRTQEAQNDFTVDITANNTGELGKIFALPVDIIRPAHLTGRINTIGRQIELKGDMPYIRYGNYDIKNITVNAASTDSTFNIAAVSDIPADTGGYKLSLKAGAAGNSIRALTNIVSNNTDIHVDGKLEASAAFSRNEHNELVSALKIAPSDIMVEKLALNLFPAEIINCGTRTEIRNLGIGMNNKKYFGIDGVISEQKSDSLKAYFNHAETGDLLEAFDIKNIRGCLHGNILLTNIPGRPELYTRDLEIADIVIFSDTLGTLNIDSQWSDYFGGVRIDAILNKGGRNLAELDGTVYTGQDSLDLQLRLQQLPLKWIQPFVAGMLNKVDGSISVNLMAEGSAKAPKIRGFLGFNNTQVGIDYTNVVYTISDTIRVAPDRIGFDNLTLRDGKGHAAAVNATLMHKNFSDMKYSLNMQMANLMVLNTLHRTDSLFYGQVYATGNVKIDGTDDGINMDMQIRNDKKSVLNVLLPQRSEASDYKSVVYINVPEEKLGNTLNDIVKRAPLPLRLNVKLTVTPDISLGVIIDQQTGDEMQAKGTGTIDFNYDMQNENMFLRGDYALADGSVKLNLQNIKKLDFKIQNGSKVYFKGDPLKTEFDITAYRRVKADLMTLDNGFDMEGAAAKTMVDCILGIKGNMNKMDVTYNISLPDANDDVRRRVNTLISTEEQKIRNFASLVATGSFYANMGGAGASFGNSIWTNIASNALSGGLTALMGNVLGDKWQIGANIESADGSVNDLDMSVNASTRFFDDKLKLSTNLGYHTDYQTTDNAFIGDFDIEYQLNSMWTLRGYSHTNDRYYRTAPTTQGIGIVYTKEAATLKRLFRSLSSGRRNRNRNIRQPADSTQTAAPAAE
jgi:hypothetical protein